VDKFELQKRTKQFAVRVYKLCEAIPKSVGSTIVIRQLIRSSTSVAANYRAACRAKSNADFLNKLKIVEEEADESFFWLDFIVAVELSTEKRMKEILQEANELVAIFTATIKSLRLKNSKN
jgi:four helix bundle protein